MVKTPKSNCAKEKKKHIIMLGLKHQWGLNTNQYTFTGGKSNPDGQYLVHSIDEDL